MIFKDKTVIVTGGSEGVGASAARKFAEAGANLVLVARSKKKLEAVASELRELTSVEIYPMDVSDARLLKQLEEENRRLKRLVADLTLDKQMLQDLASRKW